MPPYRAFFFIRFTDSRNPFGLGASQVLNLGSLRSAVFHASIQFPRHTCTAPQRSRSSLARHKKRHVHADGGDRSRGDDSEGENCGSDWKTRLSLSRSDRTKTVQWAESFLPPSCSKDPIIITMYFTDFWHRSAENQAFLLKEVVKSDFEYYLDMYRSLGSCHYIRSLHDTIPEKSMYVFKYYTGHLLSLAHKNLPIALTKRLLKDTLYGLAELRDTNIVHTGRLDLLYVKGSWNDG